MVVSLAAASTVRVTIRGTAYLPSPAIILEGTTQAAASAAAAASSASAASASASAAAASAASITLPLPVASGGTSFSSYTVGDILYASASGALAKLSTAASGVLKSGGVGLAPSYGQVTLTTEVTGTLPVANGGTGRASHTAYAVLCGGTTSTGAQQSIASVGTAGQVLKSNGAGALPTFENEAGAFVLIETKTASSSSTITFTTGLGDTLYDDFIVLLSGVKPATDDVALRLRVGTGAGPTYQTSGYIGSLTRTRGGSATPNVTNPTSYIALTEAGGTTGLGNATGENFKGRIEFSNPESSDFCEFTVDGSYSLALADTGRVTGGGRYNTAGAITGLEFSMSSGNIASGRFSLYGVKKS